MSTPEKTHAEKLIELAYEAVMQGKRVRIALWDGTGLEGSITEISEGDDRPHALPWGTPTEERLLGPMPRAITVEDETISVSEIAELDLMSD